MEASPASEKKRKPKSKSKSKSEGKKNRDLSEVVKVKTGQSLTSSDVASLPPRRARSRDRVGSEPQSQRTTASKMKRRSRSKDVPASRPGDDTGQLGSMLDQMANKHPVRRGVRSVASMPTQSRTRRRSRDDVSRASGTSVRRRPKSKDELGGSNHSQRQPPRRSSSCDENLLDSTSNGTEKSPVKRRATTKQAYLSEHAENNTGKLGNMLQQMENKTPKKRSGGRSVASMPVPRRDRSREDLSRGSRRVRREDISRKPPTRSKSSDTQALVGRARSTTSRMRSTSPSHNRRKSDDGSDDEGVRPSSKASRASRASRTSRGTRDRSREPPRRHHSATPGPKEKPQKRDPQRGGIVKSQSMMITREQDRKKMSLSNLLQEYTEDDLPSTSYFASNHVLVNRERMKRGLKPLKRNRAMDEIAREHAQKMAENSGTASLKTTFIGNVLRGESIRSIHKATMENKDGRERMNILNPYFQEFGIGTCKGEDNMLYMCQLFSESLELTCTAAD